MCVYIYKCMVFCDRLVPHPFHILLQETQVSGKTLIKPNWFGFYLVFFTQDLNPGLPTTNARKPKMEMKENSDIFLNTPFECKALGTLSEKSLARLLTEWEVTAGAPIEQKAASWWKSLTLKGNIKYYTSVAVSDRIYIRHASVICTNSTSTWHNPELENSYVFISM